MRESENFNVAIMAVLAVMAAGSLWNVWELVNNDAGTVGAVVPVISIVCLALSEVFVVLAIIRKNKWIIGALITLAILLVLTSSVLSILCLMGCGFWFGRTCQIARG